MTPEERTRLLTKVGVLRFDPKQARAPKGSAIGGRWVGDGTSSGGVKKLVGRLIGDAVEGHAAESETAAAFTEVMDGTYAGLRVRVQRVDVVHPGRAFVTAKASVLDEDGRKVGDITRTVGRDRDGRLFALHELLELSPQVRGQGFATQFNGHLDDWYRESGVERIELLANIDVGGYAWARQGYDFKNGTVPDSVVERLRDALDMRRWSDDADVREAKDALRRIEAGEHVSAYEISQIGRTHMIEGDDTWIGRDVMLGSDWDGVRWL